MNIRHTGPWRPDCPSCSGTRSVWPKACLFLASRCRQNARPPRSACWPCPAKRRPVIWPTVRSVVVSGYGLAKVEQDAAVVRPRVDRPGARVPLVLFSYEHVYWQILTTQGTQPAGVIASGYHAPAVSPDVATQGFLAGYGQPGYATKGHAPPRRSGGRRRPGHLAVQCGKGSGGPDLQGAMNRAHSPITGAYHGI